MSWIFGSLNFSIYDVKVSRSQGVLDIPSSQLEGHDWLDRNGMEYWQESQLLNGREIVLNCWMYAEAGNGNSGYLNFKNKVGAFTASLQDEGRTTFYTPYGTIPDCSISSGVQIIRETNYVMSQQVGTFTLRVTVHGDSKLHAVNIYGPTGQDMKTQVFCSSVKVNKRMMGDCYVSLSIDTNEPLNISIGDIVKQYYRAYAVTEWFYLDQLPPVTKLSSNKYRYDLRFDHRSTVLKKVSFLSQDGEADFEWYANLDEIIDRLIANANRNYSGMFIKDSVEATIRKLHSFSGESCWDVLQRMCSEYEKEYLFTHVGGNYHINIEKRISFERETVFEYGKDRGLYKITRDSINTDELCTVLYAFGAAKNLKYDYQGGKRRLICPGNPLTKNTDKYGYIEKTKYFDDVFPNRTAAVTDYYQVLPEDLSNEEKEVSPNGIYRLGDTTLEFDINENLLGTPAKVALKTGDLAGFEFEILRYDHENRYIFLIPYKDEQSGLYPNADLKIAAGDEYTLIDIKQPSTYVTEAEAALLAAAQDYLDEYSEPKVTYRVTVDPKFLRGLSLEDQDGFDTGDTIIVEDNDLGMEGNFRVSELQRDCITNVYELALFDGKILTKREAQTIRINQIQRAVDTIKATDTVSAVKQNESAEEIKGRLLDPVTDMLNADKVIPTWSIDSRMLAPDAGVPQYFFKGMIINPFVNPEFNNQISISEGWLIVTNWKDYARSRYGIFSDKLTYNPVREWHFDEINIELDTDERYLLYAKVPLDPEIESGVIIAEKGFRFMKYYIDDETSPSLYFHIATLEPPSSARSVMTLWGNAKQNEMDARWFAGSGTGVYLTDQDSSEEGYKKALPELPTEATVSYQAVSSNSLGKVLVAKFMTDAGYPGFTGIPAGPWFFQVFCGASNTSYSTLFTEVFRLDGEMEVPLFEFSQKIIRSTTEVYYKSLPQSAFSLFAETDRIVVKFYYECLTGNEHTLTLMVQGDKLSCFNFPTGGDNFLRELVFDNNTRKLTAKMTGKLPAREVTIPCNSAEVTGAVAGVKLGNLYNGLALEKIAPDGWHVPTLAEWKALKDEIDSSGDYENNVAGGLLKETGLTYWDTPNEGATNQYRFNGRGAGTRSGGTGQFNSLKTRGQFWCSDGSGVGYYYATWLFYDTDDFDVHGGFVSGETNGNSIRLVKDDSVNTGTMTGNDGKVYPTVKIGDQVWMACNLAETKDNEGNDIPEVTDNSEWIAAEGQAYCTYNNDPENAEGVAEILHNKTKQKQGGSEELDEFFHHTKDEIDNHFTDAELSVETSGDLPATSNTNNVIALTVSKKGAAQVVLNFGSLAAYKAWHGDEADLPENRDAGTIYFVNEET